MTTTNTNTINTATFDSYNRRSNQACVIFYFPTAPKGSQVVRRWYYHGELTAAARQNDWLAPVLEAARTAGLH